MPEIVLRDVFAPDTSAIPERPLASRLPVAAHYGAAVVLVALATGAAFAANQLIAAPNLTLLYVLPVVIAAGAFGWGPSLLAVGLGSAAYDFFFTAPYYSLAMTNPPEIWAVALLVVIATLVASVSATSRRRALDASRAAERAEALQALAHAVVSRDASGRVLQLAAVTLHRAFAAPAIVLTRSDDQMVVAAVAGGAQPSEADLDAARGALSTDIHIRAETYPYSNNRFDFWPVGIAAGIDCVLGVDFARATREEAGSPDPMIESVAGYVAAALASRRPVEST